VKVFSGSDGAPLGQFLASRPSYRGGLTVAAGDVEGTGAADVVVGTGRGPAQVQVFSGLQGHLVSRFNAGVRGGRGVQVAVGDLNRDTHDDIVTAPAAGAATVQVFDGATAKVLARYQAFPKAPRGGAALAVGDLDGDRLPDVIVAAGNPQGATVRAFSGLSTTPMASYPVAGREFARGVRVAAVDIGAQYSGDGVAIAPAAGNGAATVLDLTPVRLGLTGQGPAGAPPAAAFQLPDSAGGAFLAAGNSVALSTPSVVAAQVAQNASSLQPYQRLARFQFDPVTGQPEFVPVVPNDPSLVGKHVIVLVHGWAPSYSYWVNDVSNADPSQTLTWWNTDPSQAGYSLSANLLANSQSGSILGPASYFLLHGYNVNAIDVSDTGLAQSIASRAAQVDPKTVVLAYTWIDDSATSSLLNPYLSEAQTVLNGERLADGLRTVLGSQSAFGGELQLVGHSHGSKVATVAAVSLTTKDPSNPIKVQQLTILDSPEDESTLTNSLWADNFNWYYLQSLNTNRNDPNGTFVDNYISYFDEPYSNITTPTGNTLSNVVDVQLDSSDIPITDRHGYSAEWYAGSGQSALTYGQSVGQEWSPLLPGNQGADRPPADLSSVYTQPWASSSYDPTQEYVLKTTTLSPRVYKSYVLAFNTTPNTPSVAVTNGGSGASVTLTQTAGAPRPSYSGPFTTSYGRLNGISFDYQFTSVSQGATLTITLDGDPVFVMDASAVGTRAGTGTITLNQSYLSLGGNHTMDVTLTPAAGSSGVQAVVSNLNFFYATS
jgi:hypothetical protein